MATDDDAPRKRSPHQPNPARWTAPVRTGRHCGAADLKPEGTAEGRQLTGADLSRGIVDHGPGARSSGTISPPAAAPWSSTSRPAADLCQDWADPPRGISRVKGHGPAVPGRLDLLLQRIDPAEQFMGQGAVRTQIGGGIGQLSEPHHADLLMLPGLRARQIFSMPADASSISDDVTINTPPPRRL